MYNGVIAEFVDAGVAKERELPVWMDRFGNEMEERDAFGCKVTHDILLPDYISAWMRLEGTQVKSVMGI